MALHEHPTERGSTPRRRGRTYLLIALFAMAVFIGLDGYYNRWGVALTLLHWNSLVLTAQDRPVLSLKAGKDFELASIENPLFILDPDSLAHFDRPYREKYRLYFRLSDSASARLQQLYESLSTIDTSGSLKHSIEDAKLAYGNLLRVLRIDTTGVRDTLTVRVPDPSGRVMETKLLMNSDQEVTTALRTVVSKSPQLLIGVGLGLALSAGVDLLQGRAYLAAAEDDVFHSTFLRIGARAGEWEGKPVDVLWVFTPDDSVAVSFAAPDTSRH